MASNQITKDMVWVNGVIFYAVKGVLSANKRQKMNKNE